MLSLSACDDGTSVTPKGGIGLDAAPTSVSGLGADFKARYIEAACSLYVGCGLSKDPADCRKNYFEAGPLEIDTIVGDIDQGVVVYDGANASPCFAAIAALPCTIPNFSNASTKVACEPVLRGTLPLQAACVQGLECTSGNCEKTSGCTGCCLGACAAPKAKGTPGTTCKSSLECEEAAYCDLSTGSTGPYVCQPRLAMGAACTLSIACPIGAECAGIAGSRTCQTQPANGEPCAKAGPKCYSLGAYCDATTLRCKPGNQPGEPCPATAATVTSNSGCALYTRCQAGTCQAVPGLGEACALPADATVTASSVCRAGSCVSNFCAPSSDFTCTMQTATHPDAGR
jgi:hypothetical protein